MNELSFMAIRHDFNVGLVGVINERYKCLFLAAKCSRMKPKAGIIYENGPFISL